MKLFPTNSDVSPEEMSHNNNVTVAEVVPLVDEAESTNTTTLPYDPTPVFICKEPWSLVKPGVFPAFWRVVYWTSQVLTW